LATWQSHEKVDLRETEVLVGSLVHCAFALPTGRVRIAGLIQFSTTFPCMYKQRFLKRVLSTHTTDDTTWWVAQQSIKHCGSPITPPPPRAQLTIHSDTSTSFGIGITIGQHFMVWKLPPVWKTKKRDIGWAKAIAVEMALKWVIAASTHDASITIHCDNLGVVSVWACGGHTIGSKMRPLRASPHELRLQTSGSHFPTPSLVQTQLIFPPTEQAPQILLLPPLPYIFPYTYVLSFLILASRKHSLFYLSMSPENPACGIPGICG
jgi:hypothetical protein